jgi:MFS family permease
VAEQRPTPVLLTLALACVAFSLSQTLVVPALPSLAQEFDASPSTVSWVLTGFLVSASIATPIVGKLGDLFGKGRVLTAVLVLFSAGAVINALAGSIGVVIAGRLLQGVAGGVFPLAFGIVRDTFPRDQIAGGLAMISAIFGIGGGIGLPLSGVIVDNVDLQWLFWINLIALPAAFAARKLIPPSPPVENAKVDWLASNSSASDGSAGTTSVCESENAMHASASVSRTGVGRLASSDTRCSLRRVSRRGDAPCHRSSRRPLRPWCGGRRPAAPGRRAGGRARSTRPARPSARRACPPAGTAPRRRP